MRHPSPVSPSRASAADAHVLESKVHATEARARPASPDGVRETPGRSSGTRNAVIERLTGAPSTRANTSATSASSAFATQVFRPESTQPLPSGRAVVCWLCASEPALASEIANAPRIWPVTSGRSQRARCSVRAGRHDRLSDERVANRENDRHRARCGRPRLRSPARRSRSRAQRRPTHPAPSRR